MVKNICIVCGNNSVFCRRTEEYDINEISMCDGNLTELLLYNYMHESCFIEYSNQLREDDELEAYIDKLRHTRKAKQKRNKRKFRINRLEICLYDE